MVRNQTNKVAVRTQKAVADAFLALIRERAYEGISVTDICRRADIVRKTFYNNFRSKDDVVHYLIDGIFCEMESRVDFRHTGVREILLFAFRFVLDNREALLLFYRRGLLRFAHRSIADYVAQERILARLKQEDVDARAYKYIAAQISAVLISVIETWIESDFSEPVAFMAELTEALMYRPDSARGPGGRPA